jgi:hypothetical protein
MGYDSFPMLGFDRVKVAEISNLPSDHAVGFMIASARPRFEPVLQARV